jgi:ABC-type Fe3+ transport system substrate-binding protein
MQLRSRRRVLRDLALTSVSALFAARVRATEGQEWQDGADSNWAATLAAGRKEGTLVLGAPAQVSTALGQAFERDTGIAVQSLGGLNAAHSARLRTELQAGKVTIDVLLGGAQDLDFIDELRPLKPQLTLPKVTDGKYWRSNHIKWVDTPQKYMAQGAEYVGGWIIVNATVVKPETLVSWQHLLQPKYTGRIACYDLFLPGPGQSVGSWLMDLFGTEYLTKLFISQKVTFTTDPNLLIEWVARGKCDIALGGIQISVERFRRQGFDGIIVPVLLRDGPGYLTGGFSCLHMPQGLPHPNAATVFSNWYFSKPGAKVYSSIMLESSRRTDVPVAQTLDYILPKDGISYIDINTQVAYQQRPAKLAALKAALQR